MGRLIDMSGKQYGRLIVIERGKNIGKRTAWLCKCACGNPNQILVRGDHLKSGATQSCGCLHKESFSNIAKNNKVNLLGARFGNLVVIEETKERYNKGIVWKCQCDCGNIIYASNGHLQTGHIQSCGCLGRSMGEQKIMKILQQNNIVFEREKVFLDQIFTDTHKHGRYDFYLPEKNRLIEFDGEQHYQSTALWNQYNNLTQQQLHDQEKNEYALSHDIPLVRIPYWERNNITLEMLIGDQYLVRKTD